MSPVVRKRPDDQREPPVPEKCRVARMKCLPYISPDGRTCSPVIRRLPGLLPRYSATVEGRTRMQAEARTLGGLIRRWNSLALERMLAEKDVKPEEVPKERGHRSRR